MACTIEHWFVLDFALRNQPWFADALGYRGWQAKGADAYNVVATFPDVICDWLWQKPPWVPTSIAYGSSKARQDWQRGDVASAAAKLALVSHYVADLMAVSHTWLDFIADESDAESAEVFHAFHDPVENPVGDYINEARPRVPGRPADLTGFLAQATDRAYRIGKRVFDAFFAGQPVKAIVLEGVANSAAACWAVLDAVATDARLDVPEGEMARAQAEWIMAPIFDLSGEELLRECQSEPRRSAMKARLGYEGGDVFCRLDRCSPDAQRASKQWQADRRRWRAKDMAHILPPAPSQTITADWRPERDERFCTKETKT